VINIVGSARNGGSIMNNNRGSNRAAAAIGIASILYDMSQRGRQQPQVGYYPGNGYPGNGYPGNGYPGNGYPGNYNPGNYNPGNYNPGGGYPDAGYFPGNGYPDTANNGAPDGYDFIENSGLPAHLDPRVLPLTINAGGGQGDAVVARAVETWNNVGIGQVFQLTNGNADLNIDWSGSKVSQGARAETRMIRSSDFVLPTDLSVNTRGRNGEQLVQVLTHELGHVLGLDHSRDRADIMFPSEQNRRGGLSQRDLAMVHWLYNQNRYSPVVGRSDVQGAPPVAQNWDTRGLSEAEAEPVCTHQQ
jgi:hypothetical protein